MNKKDNKILSNETIISSLTEIIKYYHSDLMFEYVVSITDTYLKIYHPDNNIMNIKIGFVSSQKIKHDINNSIGINILFRNPELNQLSKSYIDFNEDWYTKLSYIIDTLGILCSINDRLTNISNNKYDNAVMRRYKINNI